jgi:hypothetical protein
MKRVVMKKPLLISIIVASASVSSMAADLFDSPGPGYRDQIERHQIERHQIESAFPRWVKDVPRDPVVNVSFSFPLTHPMYQPVPAATLLDPKNSVPSLSPLIINAFSEPIRFTSK